MLRVPAGYEVGVTPQHDGDVGSVLDFDCVARPSSIQGSGMYSCGRRAVSLGEGGEGLEEGGLPLPVACRSLARRMSTAGSKWGSGAVGMLGGEVGPPRQVAIPRRPRQ